MFEIDKYVVSKFEYQVFSKYEANIVTELHKRAISREESNFEQKFVEKVKQSLDDGTEIKGDHFAGEYMFPL